MADPGNSTTELSDTTSDLFHCPICLDGIRNPKYLPCLHTFCGSCIETYISSTATCKESESVRAIECPICRKRIEAPKKHISNEEWSSALPNNRLVANVCLNSKNVENELCKFCQRKGKTVPGRHWCKVCMETICDDCKDLHKFVPSLQNHKICDMTDSGEWRNGVEVEEFCAEHDGKVIDAFCCNHQTLCCSICLVKHHRFCPSVESLEDIAEKEENDVATILSSLSEMEKSLENMQLNNQAKISHLNTKKDAICIGTEKKIEEVKKKLDDAHEQWVKRFEQIHMDSVGNIEIVSDELKRFSTTLCETIILLQSLLANGSPKQLFITKHRQLAQMADHISRMKSLDIWNLPEDYSQPNLEFLNQVSIESKLKDVNLSRLPSGMIETILQIAPVAMTNNDIMRRRRIMSKKDWMKVEFSKTSEISLPYDVFYGLFVHDTKIVLPFKDPSSLKVFDVSTATGKCVHTENCGSRPYGLCHARGTTTLEEIYVSFDKFVVLYRINIGAKDVVICTKLQTVHLKEPMKAISCGPAAIFSASDTKAYICIQDFIIKHSSEFSKEVASVPFVSSSMTSDLHCFLSGRHVVVANSSNEHIFRSDRLNGYPKGLAFDLHDNVLVCTKRNKLQQVRHGGKESRDIELAGIGITYNVVLHPTGEKMLVMDYMESKEKCCVYQIL
uniref:Uncharacterized protein LOC111120057 n=1 Tax=Crassostrea virginica TaxID=6565 RepID=A0A8B8CKP4_CRAVI|nr:uncharacterized protein LOC111120057 [Crassostrea virginica]